MSYMEPASCLWPSSVVCSCVHPTNPVLPKPFPQPRSAPISALSHRPLRHRGPPVSWSEVPSRWGSHSPGHLSWWSWVSWPSQLLNRYPHSRTPAGNRREELSGRCLLLSDPEGRKIDREKIKDILSRYKISLVFSVRMNTTLDLGQPLLI